MLLPRAPGRVTVQHEGAIVVVLVPLNKLKRRLAGHSACQNDFVQDADPPFTHHPDETTHWCVIEIMPPYQLFMPLNPLIGVVVCPVVVVDPAG
jgi:hypothetical protein